MRSVRTYLISTIEEFHKYFPLLKADSLINGKIHAIGFDTESICKANHPDSFSKSTKWVQNNSNGMVTCTIQMASPNICLFISLVKIGLPLPKKLEKILVSDGWLKFGVGVDNDLRILSQNYNLGYCGGAMDLKSLALISCHSNPNLECLYNQFLGEGVKKTYSNRSDWGVQDLSTEQITYAAKDAVMSYRLAIKMTEPLLERLKSAAVEITINIDNPEPSSVDVKENIVNTVKKVDKTNYIGKLNEMAQKNKTPTPKYTIIQDDRTVTFRARCHFQGKETTSAWKGNKQDAKMEAALLMTEYF